ncbi:MULTISPECIES: hypothetical protein [Streptomyces]|uniref:Uncharacterized protein n=1 Tax=Streptomyces dengpaensis TaxID=2049881 RepID=A0ABN5IAC7_9ACTN|nr:MULTISPECIES: hypothetical protein [Streptomyces]AVH59951.1 hypothetical protein C4B68_33920 [Streptomyces dengpaensis]PIB09586.1 hypothetical protein B1C81_10595 [Streptomyces sp. HG99]
MTTPADELRAAAAALRARAVKVERGLTAALSEGTRDLFGKAIPDRSAMHPGVGLALAAWLDVAAEYADKWPADHQTNSPFRLGALAVARAINGGEQR